MSAHKEDPRDSSQEVALTFPKTWYQESSGSSTPLTLMMILQPKQVILANRWFELIWNAFLWSNYGDS